MLRTTTALALALSLVAPSALAGRKAPQRSPLGIDPAVVTYLSNDAPFVVFDISPRGLDGPGAGVDSAMLTFVATDPLQRVDVTTLSRTEAQGSRVADRVACGTRMAGYHACAVPLAPARAQLAGAGVVDLRIEAQGLDGQRSLVQITLAATGRWAATGKVAAAPTAATHARRAPIHPHCTSPAPVSRRCGHHHHSRGAGGVAAARGAGLLGVAAPGVDHW